MTRRQIALTIAGSDSGGGAGIQADLKTFHAFGVFGTAAVTAITAQNTIGVRAVQKVDPEVVAAQIHAVADDLPPAAVKTGMLADARIIAAVAEALRETRLPNLVVDPVMVAKSGHRLLEREAVSALIDLLLPLAQVVTPNTSEASLLTGIEVGDTESMREAARMLVERGARSVLVKGGHLQGETVTDIYHDGKRWREWSADRLDTRHTHGTGCTLSAAICSALALGDSSEEAVSRAREFTLQAIRTAPGLGTGHGPLNHWAPTDQRSRD